VIGVAHNVRSSNPITRDGYRYLSLGPTVFLEEFEKFRDEFGKFRESRGNTDKVPRVTTATLVKSCGWVKP